jgi:hypothetical protein
LGGGGGVSGKLQHTYSWERGKGKGRCLLTSWWNRRHPETFYCI